jgi:uncharacterized membrane protein
MPSPGKRLTPDAFALALLLASSLQIMENLVPRVPIFPWLKIGLSYAIILPFLLAYGAPSAFALLVARNLLGVLYGGQMFSTFLISTGSGAVAFLIFGAPVAWAFHRKLFGLVGVSVMLATIFNLSQLILVEWILIGHAGFFFQIGPLLAWSIVSGVGVAWLIRLSAPDLESALEWENRAESVREAVARVEPARWKFPAGLALLGVVLFLPSLEWQLAGTGGMIFASRRHRLPVLRSLRAAWPLLFYLGWLHLFHTPGRIVGWGGMTEEGVKAFGFHTVRLINLVVVGQALSRVFPIAWMRRSRHPAVQGFLVALPLLPGLFSFSVAAGKQVVARWRAGDRKRLLTPLFEAWKQGLSGHPPF